MSLSDLPPPVTVQLPDDPCVLVTWGHDTVTILTEDATPGEQWALPPMARAAVVARLRAAADLIENGPPA